MTPYISKSLAQQIVQTVKDLCGQNINFIDCTGAIFASTDESRTGTYHEIGRQAAVEKRTIEVTSNDRFAGTQQGVNLPVCHNHKIIAVIGISGNPDEVRQYARLAERITHLLIREKELDALKHTEYEKKASVLRGLIEHEDIHIDSLKENFFRWKIDDKASWQLLHFHQITSAEESHFHTFDSAVHQLLQKLECPLSAFSYPGEYLAALETRVLHHSRQILLDFAQSHTRTLCIAVGHPVSIYEISDSALSAEIAIKSLDAKSNYIEAADLDLELLLASASPRYQKTFLDKTICSLSPEDIELLNIYFSCGMSLKKTCEKTFRHKNTIQYHLNQIHKRCGYDPREFQDAVRLYLAVKLQKN